MADTPAPQDKDLKRSTYEFCEQAVARFTSKPPKGLTVSKMQTLMGDTVQRTYVFSFDLKMACELSD
ncbi:MAG: hypothetical protein IAE97_07050 [Chthoniobacterales bacterium]|nr:hypothetical protein [Chthoniobacterales bacterium]